MIFKKRLFSCKNINHTIYKLFFQNRIEILILIKILHITIHKIKDYKIKTIYNFYTNGGVYTRKNNYWNINLKKKFCGIYICALSIGKFNIQIKNILILKFFYCNIIMQLVKYYA